MSNGEGMKVLGREKERKCLGKNDGDDREIEEGREKSKV